jgi:S-adenosylmethionine:tRNA ribosyltransferase-isomerase
VRRDELQFDCPRNRLAHQPRADYSDTRVLVATKAEGTANIRPVAELSDALAGVPVWINDAKIRFGRLVVMTESQQSGKFDILESLGDNRYLVLCKVMQDFLRINMAWFDKRGAKWTPIKEHGRSVWTMECSEPVDFLMMTEPLLPPWIEPTGHRWEPLYAAKDGAYAAETAGVSLDHATLDRLNLKRVTIKTSANVVSRVQAQIVMEHAALVGTEEYTFADTPAPGVAIGAAACRALESVALEPVDTMTGEAGIFITPPFEFKLTRGLLLNLSRPGEIEVALAAAFVGTDLAIKAHCEAVKAGLKFGEYGDLILFLP